MRAQRWRTSPPEVNPPVADRLSPLDASFLYLESPTTAMHVGSVGVFDPPPGGLDFHALQDLVADRIAFVPRYRQRVRQVPGRLANPVWVDDEDFDITYHVRRSALPRPGTRAQLEEFVARIQSRRLDRTRPLWELYVVEGLEDGRWAMVTKTHQAMVDGVHAVDIGQVVLDADPEPTDAPPGSWQPAPEPSDLELVAGAVAEALGRPSAVVETLRTGLGDVRSSATRAAGSALRIARVAARSAPTSPLNAPIGEARRFVTVDTSLDDYRRVRKAHGSSVNDVVLATVTGALRAWLMTRGESVKGASTVRALVPVSVRHGEAPAPGDGWADAQSGGFDVGNRLSAVVVDLPIGEPSPVMRLHQVAYQMRAHSESGQAVAADTLAGVAGFAPPTLHGLAARVANGLSARLFNLVVTNVPGPQVPLYAGGARMVSAYPVTPLAAGQAVAVALTSYDGGVFYGLNADRDAMPDVAVLGQCLLDALAELVDTVR
ncbi:MAG TPA: wax ester/triacylglycerol synthase family O-acyltransferase [Motilibacteraceae bacterium]|nr:wax ester/triacylglycerol synthase family O-acyltransferase [Motilibacteraceae bacterium]